MQRKLLCGNEHQFLSRVFPHLWRIAKTFLDPKTREKCVVLTCTEMAKLLEYFEAKDLPQEYGGTCQCPNGCLPEVPKHMVIKHLCTLSLQQNEALR